MTDLDAEARLRAADWSPADAALAAHLQAEDDADRVRAAWLDALAADTVTGWRDLALLAVAVLGVPEPTTDDRDQHQAVRW